MISSGMSGIAINHSDLGGYTNVSNGMLHIDRSFILMERWAEFAAFTPIFRTHEGLLKRDDQVWGLSKPHSGFLTMAKVHDALGDYLKALNVEAHEKGWPMIRHLWLHYPEDPNVLDLKYEYLLGPDILVIPNVWLHTTNDPEKVKVPAYFPEGEWEHLIRKNIQVHGPQSLEVTAWMGCPAVYIRSDSKWKGSLQSAIAEAFAEKL
jgi:alpha-glucosidase